MLEAKPPSFDVDAAVGYSQAVRLGDLILVSGQVAFDGQGRIVGVGDAHLQARQAFENLRSVLERSGSGLERVGKITMLATSRDHLAALRAVRHEVFDPIGHYPASTFAVVSGLAHPDLLVEVEAIAAPRSGPAAPPTAS
ncbi:MAG: RidA family protein [Chloroflexi bacterium]|nr:RidA family protein [Chloroflexota bacterium]